MSLFASLFLLLGQAAEPPALAWHQEAWFRGLVAVSILVAAWGLGKWLSKVWRMPDYSFKFGLILFSLMAGAVICGWRWPPKLGIDLKGGVILIYEVAEDQQATISLAEPLDRIRNYLDRELETETQVSARGSRQIAVSTTNGDQDTADQIEEIVERIQFDLFAISAAEREDDNGGTTVVFDVTSSEEDGDLDMDKLIAALNRRINPGGQREVVVRKFGERQVEIIIPEVDPNEIDLIKDKISTAGLLEFRIIANDRDDERAILLARDNPLAKEISADGRVIAKWVELAENVTVGEAMHTRQNQAGKTEVLVRVDPYNVTGGYLSRAYEGTDQVGQPAVHFSFNAEGAVRFGELTGENLPDQATGFHRNLAIILDSQVFSWANLKSAITSQGTIEGNFTREQVQFVVQILNAGHLPAALDKTPVSQTTISPQLGADTIRNGSIAMIISTIMILVFMLVYYRFSGIVADIAVMMNLLLVLALMITLSAAFTLAGLAGLVLSVGMAVDANVLIYERMREELQRGAALRMAIRNGFSRAMSTIVDSNLTTLLTGMVLYAIGTDQLKGFAITLILGLLLNLFTAVYVARVIFDVAERRRWITELKMMKMFDAPNLDFVRPTKYAVAFSLLIIVGGLVAAVSRGEGLFGIDFTGGTSVQIVLDDKHLLTVGQVRDIVDPSDETQTRLDDVTVSSVGLPDEEGRSRYYKIDTSVENIAEVESRLKELFGEKLDVYAMSYTPPQAIPGGAQTLTTDADAAKAGNEYGPQKETGPSGKANADAAEGSADKTKEATPPRDQTKPSQSNEKAADEANDADAKTSTTPDAEPEPASDAGNDDAKSESQADSPTDGKPQASAVRSPRSWLAVAAANAFLVYQDEKAAATDDKPTDDTATEDINKVDTANEDAAKDDDAATADAKNDAQPPAKSEASKEGGDVAKDTDNEKAPATETKSVPTETKDAAKDAANGQPTKSAAKGTADAAKTTGSTVDAERPQVPGSTFAGGSSATLRFTEGINRDALNAKLYAAAKELRLEQAQFLLDEMEDTRDALNTRLFRGWQVQTTLAPADAQQVLDHVKSDLAETPIFLGANNIGGKVAGHAQVMAIYAILASMVMIIIYVWVRFQNIVFGLASVVALVHDVLVTVAALAVSSYVAPFLGWAMVNPFKISLDVVAALLTIVGFSINDTIVIFDRVREIKGKSPEITKDTVNKAVNQTLGRTVLTSGTVLIVTIILYIWGGQEIHPFAFAMLVGLVAGTYSTVYIAAPLVLWLRKPTTARRPASSRGTEVAMRA